MRKNTIKIFSVLLISTLILGAAYLTGFDFGGASKVFAAHGYCYVFQGAQYHNQTWAYEDCTWTQNEEFINDGQEAMTFEGIRIIDYHGTDTNVVVPDYIDGKPVISVSNFIAHSNCDLYENKKSIESVTLPSTLKEIIENAFKGMTWLKSIDIPANVETINDYAFYDCTNLESVTFNEGEGKGLTQINPYTFYNCTSLNTIDIPANIETINDYAFYNCTSLKSIVIPENVETINNSAFYGCTNLETVIFNEGESTGLTTIGNYVFKNCTSLVSVKLPGSLRLIGGSTFSGCSSLSDVVFNEGLERIGGGAFANCDLKSVELKEGLIKIDTDAFSGNVNLETITLPESLESIGGYFLRSTAVKKLIIPENAKDLGQILSGSRVEYLVLPSNLKNPHNKIGASNYLEILVVDSTDIGEWGVGKYPNLKAFVYKGTGTIDSSPFYWEMKYNEMKDIYEWVDYIPPKIIFTDEINLVMHNLLVKDIHEDGCGYYFRVDSETGYYIYEKSYFYDERYISSGVNCTDGEYKYYITPDGGAVITEYTGAGGVVTVPEYFENEGTMHNIIGIGRRVFKDCAITNIILPSTLEMIGDHAFYATEITSVTFPDSLKYIGEYAFAKTKITDIIVSGNIKTVSKYCFSECPELKSAVFSEGVEYIEEGAFYNSSGPYDIISVPTSMREISEYAFYNITNIDHFIFDATCYESDLLPYEDDYYDDYYHYIDCFPPNFANGRFSSIFDAETNKIQINKITIGTSVKYIPYCLFYNADVSEISLPDNIIGIGEMAFMDCEISNRTLDIPDTLKKINKYAFEYSNITELTLPEGLEYVSEFAFYYTTIKNLNYSCKNCVFEYNYKTEIEGIYKSPFAYCESLKTINIGESVDVIPDFFFNSIPNLETVNFPDHITSLGKGAFAFSGIETINGLEELKNIEVIDDYTFYNCKNLTEFDMTGLNVTEIGDYAFANSGLVTFNGNGKLESIGDGCFEGCKNLKTVNLGSNTATVGTSSFLLFRNADFISSLSNIGSSAFANCTSLAEIEIPDSVKTIGEKAFYGDIALKNVEMSNNVTSVADECFNGCAELDSFVWNAESKHIGRLAFANCVNLAEFDFVNLEKLYDNSFLNSGVADVQLGEAKDEAASELKEIETQSFMNCDNLTSVGVGGNVTTIKTQAFADCENLETVYIADSVTEIAADAFDGCENMMIYCSVGSYAYTYAQTQGFSVSTLVIDPIPNQTYTGFEIKPEISVSASGDKLAENVDFGVTYANNINVGNADVTVKGKGDFRMFASKAMFTIVTKNISAVTVAPIADQTYTGTAVTPEITVTDGIKVLREGTDYTVAYTNNANAGTATVTITGIGNYSGTATTNFQISKDAEEPVEPSFFEKVFSAALSFFARIIVFLISLFM